MDRPSVRYGIALALALTMAVLPAFGCRSALATVMFLFKGTDEDPEFAELEGQEGGRGVPAAGVAAISQCERQPRSGRANHAPAAGERAQDQDVDQRKIAKWTDENTWEEYSEVGKALKADMVVGIDLEGFSFSKGRRSIRARPTPRSAFTIARRAAKWCSRRSFRRRSIRPTRPCPPRSGWSRNSAASSCRAGRPDRPALLRPRSLRRHGPRRRGAEIIGRTAVAGREDTDRRKSASADLGQLSSTVLARTLTAAAA